MDQVQPKDFGPGNWTIAHYQDAPARIVYQCACGKVNALPLEERSSETGVMMKEVGDPDPETGVRATEPAVIECERKTCESKDQLTLVAHTEAEMETAAREAAALAAAADMEPTPAS